MPRRARRQPARIAQRLHHVGDREPRHAPLARCAHGAAARATVSRRASARLVLLRRRRRGWRWASLRSTAGGRDRVRLRFRLDTSRPVGTLSSAPAPREIVLRHDNLRVHMAGAVGRQRQRRQREVALEQPDVGGHQCGDIWMPRRLSLTLRKQLPSADSPVDGKPRRCRASRRLLDNSSRTATAWSQARSSCNGRCVGLR